MGHGRATVRWRDIALAYSLQISILVLAFALLVSSVALMFATQCREGWEKYESHERRYARGCAPLLETYCNGSVTAAALSSANGTAPWNEAYSRANGLTQRTMGYCVRRCAPCFH
jgi:hypothetical protein